jgi:uncharacterized damage-inducible protein DinB
MTPGITFEELMDWNEESATFWKAHLEANPALLELPCGIGGAGNVRDFMRHIWGVELRWAQRIAGLPVTERKDMPEGPLDALFGLHRQAMEILRTLLVDSAQDWDETRTMDYDWLPPHARTCSRRKLLGHALLHSERHWAQLATLLRSAGFPSGFLGDLLFSRSLA